jgi:hypothetical protein
MSPRPVPMRCGWAADFALIPGLTAKGQWRSALTALKF